jgi:hypothetical protein
VNKNDSGKRLRQDSIAASGLVARLVLDEHAAGPHAAARDWRQAEKVVSTGKAVHNMAFVFCLI